LERTIARDVPGGGVATMLHANCSKRKQNTPFISPTFEPLLTLLPP
jgi:hypothetical protein